MKDYPLIKFTLLFISGILLQYYGTFEHNYLLLLFVLLIATSAILTIIPKDFYKSISNVSIMLSVLLFGAVMYSTATLEKVHYPFNSPKIKNVEVFGSVDKIALIREKRLTFYISTDSLKIGYKTIRSKTKILCNIYDSQKEINKLYSDLKVGNHAVFTSTINRPKNTRNPYEFDYEKYLNDRGVSVLATAYSTESIHVNHQVVSTFKNSIHEIRKYLDNKITTLHNQTTEGLLRGLLLADRSGIDYNTNSDFMNAGVVHVLSVSGLHVGYIVIIFLFLFNRFNLYWRVSLTIFGLFTYMIITGSEAPVFRSTIMASVILITPFLGRESSSYNTLSLAALIILLLNPVELFNPSFQLSFSAILALIIFFPIIKKVVYARKYSSKFLNYFLLFLGSTFVAQIGTLPFTLSYFGRISLTSLAANFFVIPLSGIIVGLGIVSLALSTVSFWLAGVYASCNEFLTYLLFLIVRFFGNPNYSFISIKQFSLYDSIMFYLSLGILVTSWKKFQSVKSKTIFVILLGLSTLTAIQFADKELLTPKKLTIVSIDVGQGDAFLIKFPNGKTALVDAGDATLRFDNGKRVILPLLEKLGINKIDYAFISHIDSDHYMGVLSLIKEKKIAELYKPEINSTKQNDLDFEGILKRNGIPVHHYKHESLAIGNAKLYFLHNDLQSGDSESSNDNSGVFKLVYAKNSILFTGDAGVKVEEKYIAKYGKFLKSNILKVGHHGSKTSSSGNFLQSVSPKYALISAGIMNKFRHPSTDVLDRLRKLHTKILRTDELGASIICSDGSNIEIVHWRNN